MTEILLSFSKAISFSREAILFVTKSSILVAPRLIFWVLAAAK